jgi:hypothetical protein
MSVLSWGKCQLEHATSSGGVAGTQWTKLPVPKDGTTKLTPTAGTQQTALEEGGDQVDVRNGKTTFTLEFDLFVKKGEERPFDDNDGVIAGEHAFRLTPEDEECEGILIESSVLRVEESYSTADGKLLHYVANALKPKEGKTVKPYVAKKAEDTQS